MRAGLLLCALTFTLAACSDAQPAPSPSGTGGSSQSGTGGTGGTGGSGAANGGASGTGGTAAVCNDLVADAPNFQLTTDSGAAPAAKGGTIADGTYFATQEILYQTGASLTVDMGSAKVVIAGSAWQEVDGAMTGRSTNLSIAATFSTEGTTLTLNKTCPKVAKESYPFTADTQGFSFYGSDHGVAFAVTFARQ
jgi:hypothetical protein